MAALGVQMFGRLQIANDNRYQTRQVPNGEFRLFPIRYRALPERAALNVLYRPGETATG